MAKTKAQASVAPAVVAPESPLVPNATMRRMYEGMVGSRLLAEALRTSPLGQEAGRMAAMIDLQPDDLTSDSPGSRSVALLRGVEPRALLRLGLKKASDIPVPGSLATPADPAMRFSIAVGAALAIKRLALRHAVVLFASAGEAKWSVWRKALEMATAEELAMFFVVLPASDQPDAPVPGKLSARATAAGVPGIPVEGTDAVALYRVAQESLHRARAGGGPALMECVRFVAEGTGKTRSGARIDPVEAMGRTLLARGICNEKWMAGVARAFRKQLAVR